MCLSPVCVGDSEPGKEKEGDVLEHALTCHIVFVTLEGRAPKVSGALTLQLGGDVSP